MKDVLPAYFFTESLSCAGGTPAFVVATRTGHGYRVRSTHRTYRHDYVSRETLQDVQDWMRHDMTPPELCTRSQFLERLTEVGSAHRTGYLAPPNERPEGW